MYNITHVAILNGLHSDSLDLMFIVAAIAAAWYMDSCHNESLLSLHVTKYFHDNIECFIACQPSLQCTECIQLSHIWQVQYNAIINNWILHDMIIYDNSTHYWYSHVSTFTCTCKVHDTPACHTCSFIWIYMYKPSIWRQKGLSIYLKQ